MVTLKINIRRFDFSNNPPVEKANIECDPDISYTELKRKIMDACKLIVSEHKIIKLRNSELVLIPYSMMLENEKDTYFVDVTNVSQAHDTGMNLLQDAYINSVYCKLNNMESRIQQAEKLLPQLECIQRTHLEETVSHLSSKVLFLNRRFDEILPLQWPPKTPYTMA
ncbi:uncharacterized protein LOC123322155 [Coccinella septempunctata]|uniref:uncharacterized protein LOC123322155 n=1 Tax=Coccinella septempunctata TaxID=41139 RepID=UPI001D063C42|nr:uncharacterized protein LOC123322155 [Coccinella septempunctata]